MTHLSPTPSSTVSASARLSSGVTYRDKRTNSNRLLNDAIDLTVGNTVSKLTFERLDDPYHRCSKVSFFLTDVETGTPLDSKKGYTFGSGSGSVATHVGLHVENPDVALGSQNLCEDSLICFSPDVNAGTDSVTRVWTNFILTPLVLGTIDGGSQWSLADCEEGTKVAFTLQVGTDRPVEMRGNFHRTITFNSDLPGDIDHRTIRLAPSGNYYMEMISLGEQRGPLYGPASASGKWPKKKAGGD